MTISDDTAKNVAKNIYELAVRDGVPDPLAHTLAAVEIVMMVKGNKSFQDSMKLVHRAVKDYHLSLKEPAEVNS